MRIAITADAHLREGGEHPERYNALENIFQQATEENIDKVIIAGDLFDKEYQNYSEFERLCAKYAGLELLIIPGNHDPNINQDVIVGANIRIFTEPTIEEIDSISFLFVPYRRHAKMGDDIDQMKSGLNGEGWILVGHGDFHGGVQELNPLEPGTYMPLSRTNVERFSPGTVFLGHIHRSYEPYENVHYAGSPCGLDITETGLRSFLIYDTSTAEVEDKRVVKTDVLYFRESFQIIPRDNEIELLGEQIEERIEAWEIEPSDYEKVQLRLSATGYAKNKSGISEAMQQSFAEFSYYKNEGPDISKLSVSSDELAAKISDQTMKKIEELDWPFGGDQPPMDMVKEEALKVIYGDEA